MTTKKLSPSIYNYLNNPMTASPVQNSITKLESGFIGSLLVTLTSKLTREYYNYETRELDEKIYNILVECSQKSTKSLINKIKFLIENEWTNAEIQAKKQLESHNVGKN